MSEQSDEELRWIILEEVWKHRHEPLINFDQALNNLSIPSEIKSSILRQLEGGGLIEYKLRPLSGLGGGEITHSGIEVIEKREAHQQIAKATGHASARLRTNAISNAVVEPPLVVDQDSIPSPEVHAEMLSWIGVVERSMEAEQEQRPGGQPPGIGHNRPPIPFDDEELREIREAIATLKAQPVVPKELAKAKAAASTLQKIVKRTGAWFLQKGDLLVDEVVKAAAKQFPLWVALLYLVQAVQRWLGQG
jgi:hypothetical protein